MSNGAPILDGVSGFVLLTLSVGIGAYVRQVYVEATKIYDDVNSGELRRLWPLDKEYTQKRLKNLRYVQKWLRIATSVMFAFMALASARLIASAINAIVPIIPDIALRVSDLLLVVVITSALLMMWRTHHVGSKKERHYLKKMRKALKEKRSQARKNQPRADGTDKDGPEQV